MKKLFMGFVTAALLTVCLCVPAFAADADRLCTHWEDYLDHNVKTDGLCIYYASDDHFFYCPVCDVMFSSSVIGGPLPHSDDSCEFCTTMSFVDAPFYALSEAPGVLPSITTLVTTSIDWLTAFALCILSTPLFLIFVCCIFVGLGIALIKRSIRL